MAPPILEFDVAWSPFDVAWGHFDVAWHKLWPKNDVFDEILGCSFSMMMYSVALGMLEYSIFIEQCYDLKLKRMCNKMQNNLRKGLATLFCSQS